MLTLPVCRDGGILSRHRIGQGVRQTYGTLTNERASCLRWVRAIIMLSARSRKNLVFLSGELTRVPGHYLASILAGYDGGVCKP
jgi:hypothetical protein